MDNFGMGRFPWVCLTLNSRTSFLTYLYFQIVASGILTGAIVFGLTILNLVQYVPAYIH